MKSVLILPMLARDNVLVCWCQCYYCMINHTFFMKCIEVWIRIFCMESTNTLFSLSEFFKWFAVEYVSQYPMRLMENQVRQAYHTCSWILSVPHIFVDSERDWFYGVVTEHYRWPHFESEYTASKLASSQWIFGQEIPNKLISVHRFWLAPYNALGIFMVLLKLYKYLRNHNK